MTSQTIIHALKEALDHAYGEQPDWCPPAVWAEAKGWAEGHLSMQATGAASGSLPVAIIAKAILAAKAEEREACAMMAEYHAALEATGERNAPDDQAKRKHRLQRVTLEAFAQFVRDRGEA